METNKQYQRTPQEFGVVLTAPVKIQELKEIIEENKLRIKTTGDLLLVIGANKYKKSLIIS